MRNNPLTRDSASAGLPVAPPRDPVEEAARPETVGQVRRKVAQTDNALAFLRLRSQRRKHSQLTATEKASYEEFLANHRALDLTHGGQAPHSPRVVRGPDDPQRSRSVG